MVEKANEACRVQEAALELVPSAEDPVPGTRERSLCATRRARAKLPADLSPRARLFSAGPAALSPVELLAVVLGSSGSRGERLSLHLAAEVLRERGGLDGLARSSVYDLLEVGGVGEAAAAALLAAAQLGKRLAADAGPDRPVVSHPADVASLLRGRIAHEDREHFVAVLLNTKNRVIGAPTISVGTLSSSLVHPREVFKPAIKAGAAGVVLCHNHPSGNPEPSREDRDVTRRLVEVAEVVGIEVLDHVVLGSPLFFSLKEHGYL